MLPVAAFAAVAALTITVTIAATIALAAAPLVVVPVGARRAAAAADRRGRCNGALTTARPMDARPTVQLAAAHIVTVAELIRIVVLTFAAVAALPQVGFARSGGFLREQTEQRELLLWIT